MSRWVALLSSSLALAAVLSPCAQGAAQLSDTAPPGLENVGVDEHLDRRVPTDLTFRDHTGRRVQLADLLHGDRPVLLNLVYYSCPSFCSLVLDGTAAALNVQPWTAGVEFDVLTISIDPRDTPEDAAERRTRVLRAYSRDAAQEGWHFLVAERSVDEHEALATHGVYPAIERLTEALGYRYQWMPRQRQYAHPGAIVMLTPEMRVARYLYGIEFAQNDVRLGLLEASEGRSISTVEHAILYCYRYDAEAQGYSLVAWRVMQIGGAISALLLFLFLLTFWRRELKKRGESARASELRDSGLANQAP